MKEKEAKAQLDALLEQREGIFCPLIHQNCKSDCVFNYDGRIVSNPVMNVVTGNADKNKKDYQVEPPMCTIQGAFMWFCQHAHHEMNKEE